jgi:drug/metabolite transporter, DME family
MAHVRALSTGRGLFFVAIAATSWGIGGFVAAVLYQTSGLGPIAVSFWRFVGGLVLLTAGRLILARRRAWTVSRRRILLTGCGFALYQTAYYASIQLAGLTVGTVVTLGAGPILIALGGRFFLGERLGARGSVTIAASLVGLVLLVGARQPAGPGSDPLLGVGVALVSAGGYASVTLLARADRDQVDPLDAALGGFAVGSVCLLPLALVEGLRPAGDLGLAIGLLAFLGAVPTALAYALFFRGLGVVRATTASVVALVEPVAAAVFAVVALGERLTALGGTGGALLLASVTALALSEREG